jgi:hypothetical protein
MTSTTDDRTRQWIVTQRVLWVAFILACVMFGVLGEDFLPGLLVVGWLFLAGAWVCQANRPWWGSGPRAILADPDLRRAWRRNDVRFEVVSAVVIVIVVPLVLTVTGIAPPGKP